MHKFLILILFCIYSFYTAPTYGQSIADFSQLELTGEDIVRQVISPLTIRTQKNQLITLVNIDIPDYTPHEAGPVARNVMAVLEKELVNQTIKIYQSKEKSLRRNNMGHELAHISSKAAGTWIQGYLLENGLARLHPEAINTELIPQMKTLEETARKDKKGLWQDKSYQLQGPENVQDYIGKQVVIEGKILSVSLNNNITFLNFGRPSHKTFSVGITPRIRKQLHLLGQDPLKFANHYVRVRGYPEYKKGPYIELLHPIWIEVLPEIDQEANVASD
jgi:endonuclease YncB( thermonuclease family)